MRRLLSYILLSSAMLIGTAVSLAPTISRMNSDLSYSDGRTLTFRITEKEEEGRSFYNPTETDVSIFDDDYVAVNAVAKEIRSRLDVWGVSGYEVDTVGYDTVNVTLRPNYEDSTEYIRLQRYLSFSGQNISLSASHIIADSYSSEHLDELFVGQEAHLEYIENQGGGSSYPVVVMPVRRETQYEAAFNDLIKYCNDNTKGDSNTEDQEDDSFTTYLIVWGNQQEGDVPTEGDVDMTGENVADRIISSEVTGSNNAVWYASSDKDKEDPFLQIVPSNVTASDPSVPYREACYIRNLLNASKYDYQVDYLYSTDAEASVEDLIALTAWNRVPAMGRTMIATLIGVAFLALILAFFERLSALQMVSITSLGVFLSFLLFVSFGVQFNIAALFGLLAVAGVSLFSQIYYNAKAKDEIYKGRTLKKANQEAAKKAVWPTIDAGILSVIFGLFTYLFAGDLASKLGAMLVIGGIVTTLLNLIVYRFSSYLLYNDNDIQTSFPKLLGINKEKIPNLLKEEKQSYFGPYANRNFKKGAKWTAIAGGVLLAAGIVTMSVFGALNGTIYNNPNQNAHETVLVFEARTTSKATDAEKSNDTELSSTSVLYKSYTLDDAGNVMDSSSNEQAKRSLLRNIYFNGKSFDKLYASEDALFASIREGDNPKSVFDTETNVRYDWYYFEVALPVYIDADQIYSSDVFTVKNIDANTESSFTNINDALQDLVLTYLTSSDPESSTSPVVVSAKNIAHAESQPYFWRIALAAGVGLATALVYLMLRFGISRGLFATLIAAASSYIALAFFVFTRIPVQPVVAVASVGVALIALLILLFPLNKEKEIVKDAKEKERAEENFRELTIDKAIPQSAHELFLFSLLLAYLALCYFGFGPTAFNSIYLNAILGILFAVCFSLTLLAPTSSFLKKKLSKIHIHLPQRKKRVGELQQKKSRSAEPEEATIIGIND